MGLAAGLLGSVIIVIPSVIFTPFCPQGASGWSLNDRLLFAIALAFWGALGSLLDSFLGGWLQASVVDTRTGKVVEGDGGKKVLISKSGPGSMHYENQAKVKAAILNGAEKDAVAKPAPEQTVVENILDQKSHGINRYDPKNKSRKPSFGDEKPSRFVESGSLGLLDNNEVNFLMALTMSLGAMGVASRIWDVPLQSMFLI